MKNLINKIYTYYKYNGLKDTIVKVCSKIFKFPNSKYLKQMKNFELDNTSIDDSIVLKNGKNVFIFATVPFYDIGGGQRSAQLAITFNKMGFNVFYIYAFDSNEKNIPKIDIPTTFHKNIINVSIMEFEKYVKADDLFIFEAPIKSFEKFLEIAKKYKCRIVYENIDNWESSLGNNLLDRKTLNHMYENSDLVVATAIELVNQSQEQIKKLGFNKQVHYLPNAVNNELFNPSKHFEKPKDLLIGEKTLLYYGSLWGEWFDWNIIKCIAEANENIAINLIGYDKNIKSIKKSLPSNVKFLGLKKQSDLPAYLKYVDYAILPFKPGNISNYVSPLKIFEYISMEKIVFTTNLPYFKDYPNVKILKSDEEWIKAIKTKYTIKNSNSFIQKNNWYDRCAKILEYIYPLNVVQKEFYKNISIIVLNYNNKNVIFKCVDTLLEFKERYGYQIIVVDNMSNDGSYEQLLNYGQKITLLRNNKNGCSSGRNLGVKNAKYEYIFFLDSDQWVCHKYWLDNYLNIFSNIKDIGAIGCSAGWFDKQGHANKVADAYKNRFMPPNILARSDVGYLATCGFFMRKDLFNKVGGFDTAYDPTCYEDTDLSLAIRNSNHEIYYSIYLGVGHLPHQTTKSGTKHHAILFKQKGEYFHKKWISKNSSLINNYKK